MQDYFSIMNVAPGKSARISDTSQWSTANDCTDVLKPTNRNFAFHTSGVAAPSLEIDLETVHRLDKLRIFNRKDGHQHRASSLIVEVSVNEQDWTTLHSGTLFWSGCFELPCNGMIEARYVRLRLAEEKPFHLQRIEINARHYNHFGEPVFIARRTDGLGERLNALINAIWLSDLVGTGFRFSWGNQLVNDPLHAIVPVEKMFSQDFIDAHLVPMEDGKGAWDFSGRVETIDTIKWKVINGGPVSGPRTNLSSSLSQDGYELDPSGSVAAFERIGFSQEIQEALDLADAVPLSDKAVGLHLRSGDIFYKDFRKYVHYTYKGLTIPIAKMMIEKFKAEGYNVYLFGQDEEQIAYLAQTCGAVDAATLNVEALARMDRHQKAMYDLRFLSRFPKILAGSSGFARQASLIGGGTTVAPADLFSAKEQHQASIADLAAHDQDYHPLQSAFAYWYAYFYGRKGRDAQTNMELLLKAIRFDPDNELYVIVLAALLGGENQAAKAETVLHDLFLDRLAKDRLPEIFRIFKARTLGKFNLQEFFPPIEAGAEAGGVFQAALMASLYKVQGKAEAEAEALKLCRDKAEEPGAHPVYQAILAHFD